MSPRRITTQVRIGGRFVDVVSIRTGHDVDRPVGTATLVLPAPRPVSVQINADVTVMAGYDGSVRPIFAGRVASIDTDFDDGGGEVRVECEGRAWRLFGEMYRSLGFNGPMRLDRYFANLCAWRGVPNAWSDIGTAPDGSEIMLGANAQFRGGWIPLDAGENPGDLLVRTGELFGFHLFDRPDGIVRYAKIVGLPPDFAVGWYVEGENMLMVGRGETLDGIVNYWDVQGPKYQAADTSEVAIRSIPASVTPDRRLGPEGIVRRKLGPNDTLSTPGLAQSARNVHEINYGEEQLRFRWQTTGDPRPQPGEAVTVQSATVNGVRGGDLVDELIAVFPAGMWLMRVEHAISENGWTTTMEGWAGAGRLVPAGNDCVTQTLLGPEGRHLGTEYLGHYRRPNPDGLQIDIPFTVAEDYSTLTIRGMGHGVNSFAGNAQTEVSRFEIWQTQYQSDRAMASGDMPRLDEQLEQRYPYGEKDAQGAYTNRAWQELVIPLTGSLKAGSAVLRIISELDRDIGDYDDYEVANLALTACGVGEPVILGQE